MTKEGAPGSSCPSTGCVRLPDAEEGDPAGLRLRGFCLWWGPGRKACLPIRKQEERLFSWLLPLPGVLPGPQPWDGHTFWQISPLQSGPQRHTWRHAWPVSFLCASPSTGGHTNSTHKRKAGALRFSLNCYSESKTVHSEQPPTPLLPPPLTGNQLHSKEKESMEENPATPFVPRQIGLWLLILCWSRKCLGRGRHSLLVA